MSRQWRRIDLYRRRNKRTIVSVPHRKPFPNVNPRWRVQFYALASVDLAKIDVGTLLYYNDYKNVNLRATNNSK